MNDIEEYYNFFLSNSLNYDDIDVEVLEKFLILINETPNPSMDSRKELLQKKINNYELKDNYRLQLLWHGINLGDESIKLKFLDYYYDNSPSTMFSNMKILKVLYPTVKSFVSEFKFIFNDNYFTQSVMYQKAIIFYFYFMSNMIYKRGKDYKYYYKVLYRVFKRFIQDNNDEMAFYIYVPLLMSSNGIATTRDGFKKFNTKVELKLENMISDFMIPKYNIQEITKHKNDCYRSRVAFLIEGSTWHSVNNVLYQLLQNLKKYGKNKYEFIILNLETPEHGELNRDTVKKFLSLGFEYYDLHLITDSEEGQFYNQVEKALKVREFIISKNINTLINISNWHPIYTFLFTTRTCQKQIYWSHGNYGYDIKGINTRFTHSRTYDIEKYKILDIAQDFKKYTSPKDLDMIQKVKDCFSPDTIILGTIGRLVKIDSDPFLNLIAKVLHDNKNLVFLACGGGDQDIIKSKIIKLGIENQFILPGHIHPSIYGYAINVFCWPFPYGSGEVYAEYELKEQGGAVVYQNTLNDIFFFDKNIKESLTFSFNTTKKYKEMVKDLYSNFYDNKDLNKFDLESLSIARDKVLKDKFGIMIDYSKDKTLFGNSEIAYENRLRLLISNPSFRKYYGDYNRAVRVNWNDIIKQDTFKSFSKIIET